MVKEYKIKFDVPVGYNPSKLFDKLPSPINKPVMVEIYNYKIEKDGFYFVDRLVNSQVASAAFKFFVDEALEHATSVELIRL